MRSTRTAGDPSAWTSKSFNKHTLIPQPPRLFHLFRILKCLCGQFSFRFLAKYKNATKTRGFGHAAGATQSSRGQSSGRTSDNTPEGEFIASMQRNARKMQSTELSKGALLIFSFILFLIVFPIHYLFHTKLKKKISLNVRQIVIYFFPTWHGQPTTSSRSVWRRSGKKKNDASGSLTLMGVSAFLNLFSPASPDSLSSGYLGRSGELDLDEVRAGAGILGISEEQAEELFYEIDTDGGGSISMDE
jgi:hypothetical protein